MLIMIYLLILSLSSYAEIAVRSIFRIGSISLVAPYTNLQGTFDLSLNQVSTINTAFDLLALSKFWSVSMRIY